MSVSGKSCCWDGLTPCQKGMCVEVSLGFCITAFRLLLHRLLTFGWQRNSLICAADGANDNAGAKILPNISLIRQKHTEHSFCSHLQSKGTLLFRLGVFTAVSFVVTGSSAVSPLSSQLVCEAVTCSSTEVLSLQLGQEFKYKTLSEAAVCTGSYLRSSDVLWVSSIFTWSYQTGILYC